MLVHKIAPFVAAALFERACPYISREFKCPVTSTSSGEGLASCVLRARGETFAGASVALQNPSRASIRALSLGVGFYSSGSEGPKPVMEVSKQESYDLAQSCTSFKGLPSRLEMTMS